MQDRRGRSKAGIRPLTRLLTMRSAAIAIVGGVMLVVGLTAQTAPVLYELKDAAKYNVPVAYHLATCEQMKSLNMSPVKPVDIIDTGLAPCPFCKPLNVPAVAEMMRNTPQPRITFVSPEELPIYGEPVNTGKPIGTLGAAVLASLYQVQAGWARISSFTDESERKTIGWVKATPENLVSRDRLQAIGAWLKTQETTWPAATKSAVIRGDIKIGFTIEQLDAAAGAPISTVTEETASGTLEVRVYPGKSVSIVGGRVTRIVTTK